MLFWLLACWGGVNGKAAAAWLTARNQNFRVYLLRFGNTVIEIWAGV